MQKRCPKCGSKIDEYVYIYQPWRADQVIEDIKAQFPNIDITLNTIEGEKIKVEFKKKVLTPAEKKKMDGYFDGKGYSEDIDAEKKKITG